MGGEGPERQLWTGSIPCLPRRVDWKRRQGQSSRWKSSGGRRRGENMAGVGGGGSYCNGNPVSPSALAAPAAPGSSLTALRRGAAMAADSSQSQLPSHTAGLPVACLPNTVGRGGRRRERLGRRHLHAPSLFSDLSLLGSVFELCPREVLLEVSMSEPAPPWRSSRPERRVRRLCFCFVFLSERKRISCASLETGIDGT